MATKQKKKNKPGKPPKYASGKDIWAKADEYFKKCDDTRQMPEKAGLCLFLGISRDTYSEYRKKYPDTIKAIDLYIESNWVRRLSGQAATGAIFYLKNAFKEEYKDRQETDITTQGQQITSINVVPIKQDEDTKA